MDVYKLSAQLTIINRDNLRSIGEVEGKTDQRIITTAMIVASFFIAICPFPSAARLPQLLVPVQIIILMIHPVSRANTIVNDRYKIKRFNPSTIFTAPRLVIFVVGPVIINAEALPRLIPSESHCNSNGIVPPPHA